MEPFNVTLVTMEELDSSIVTLVNYNAIQVTLDNFESSNVTLVSEDKNMMGANLTSVYVVWEIVDLVLYMVNIPIIQHLII